jgi:MSHA biogenesis protein MshN
MFGVYITAAGGNSVMSLLNDMLRDLNQRPSVEGVDEQDMRLLKGNRKATPRLRMSVAVIFLLIFFNVLALRYVWHKWNPAQTATEIQAVVKSPDIKLQTELPKPAAQANASPVVNADTAARVEDLFQQAERALSMDRLTAPVEDNAYSYYQKILQLSPDNAEAEAGLVAIAERYLVKAHEQFQAGNRAQAEALVNRARFVAPDYVNAQPDSRLEVATSSDHQEIASVSPGTFPSETDSTSTASELLAEAPAAGAHETVTSLAVAEAPSLAVKPNAGWQDEQTARSARSLLEQGRATEAIALLKRALVSQNQPAISAGLLADIYLQQGELGAAEVLLDQLTYLTPLSRTKIQAQLAVAKGDQEQAISLLEQQVSEATADESYRALLASLYHKTGNYGQSVTHYQRLIASFGEQPAYWLGLALAYDGLAQPKNALQAYLHLRDFPQLQEQVKTYTDQRIAALRSQ